MSELNDSQQKNLGLEELLMFYTVNTTVEACAEWVAAVATPHTVIRSLQRKPPSHWP